MLFRFPAQGSIRLSTIGEEAGAIGRPPEGSKTRNGLTSLQDEFDPHGAVEDWVEEALKDLDTGLPPVPLKLKLGFPLGNGILIGHYQGGEDPKGGTRYRSVDIQVAFPDQTSSEVVAWTTKAIVSGLGEDPTLCGRLDTGRLVDKEHSFQGDGGTYGERSDLLTVHALLSTLE